MWRKMASFPRLQEKNVDNVRTFANQVVGSGIVENEMCGSEMTRSDFNLRMMRRIANNLIRRRFLSENFTFEPHSGDGRRTNGDA